MMQLALKNKHERDSRITFDEGPHIYTIDKTDSNYTSVTTWVHSHFQKFDADKIIKNMMNSKRWSENKYYGMNVEEIKFAWDKNRDEAAAAGTKMHYDIECYYNGIEVNNNSVEYGYFQQFLERYEKELKPYRTEWMVFHEELRLSGSIDMVYECNDGSGDLLIYDWKRCKEIKKADRFGKCGNKECIEHLPDTNYWHYCLQLNTYKAILEAKYGRHVREMYLVCLHPDNKNRSYQRIKVMDLSKEITDLFTLRENQKQYKIKNSIKSKTV